MTAGPPPDDHRDAQERSTMHELTTAARGLGAGSESLDFISSVIAGLILGLALDWWLDTAPIFVVIGIVVGFVAGFIKLWTASQVLERQAEERRRG